MNAVLQSDCVDGLRGMMMRMRVAVMVGVLMLQAACASEDETASTDLSADCQAAYEVYLKHVDALPAEEVKQITATTGMSVDEAKKISRQMYADMSDADCRDVRAAMAAEQ